MPPGITTQYSPSHLTQETAFTVPDSFNQKPMNGMQQNTRLSDCAKCHSLDTDACIGLTVCNSCSNEIWDKTLKKALNKELPILNVSITITDAIR